MWPVSKKMRALGGEPADGGGPSEQTHGRVLHAPARGILTARVGPTAAVVLLSTPLEVFR